MINLLLSVLLFAAVKATVLLVSATNGQGLQRVRGLLAESEDGVALVGKHNGHAMDPSQHFRLAVPKHMGSRRRGSLLQRCVDRSTTPGGSKMKPLHHGLVHLESTRSVLETMSVLEGIVVKRRFVIMARIDHPKGAARLVWQCFQARYSCSGTRSRERPS